MMKRLTWFLLLTALLVTACTEVELCYEAEHPHRTGVTFTYSWDADADADQPDTMAIAAIRVYNLWKCGIYVNTEHGDGFYFHNAPQTVPSWEIPEPEPEDSVPGSPDTDVTIGDDVPVTPEDTIPVIDPEEPHEMFELREGTYRFYTINYDSTEVRIHDIIDYVRDDVGEIDVNNVYIEYTTYETIDSLNSRFVDHWTDYNPKFPFIYPKGKPLYFDTLAHYNIYKEQENHVEFHPFKLTQHIDVYFNLQKDSVGASLRIDSVFAEISGIPVRMNPFNKHIDLRRTAKIQFPTELESEGGGSITDNFGNGTKVRVHGVIDVPTVVNCQSPSDISGPGFMQVLAFTTATDSSGKEYHKRIQGRMNVYHAIQEADLIEYSEDGEMAWAKSPTGVIDIKAKIVISGDDVVNNSDDDGGIDTWQEADDSDDPTELEL